MRLLRSIFSLLLVSSSVQAASIYWEGPETIAGDSDVSTEGTLLWAHHYTYSTANDAEVNGVTFAGVPYNTVPSSQLTLSSDTLWAQNTTFEGPEDVLPYSGLSSEYQTVLSGGAYWNDTPGTITLNSLEIGTMYHLQIWVNDSREGGLNGIVGRNQYASDGLGHQILFAFNDGVSVDGGSLGQYVIGTFVAEDETQSFTLTVGPGGDHVISQVNAMQLRVVPEPSVYALFATGAALLFLKWRARRAVGGAPTKE